MSPTELPSKLTRHLASLSRPLRLTILILACFVAALPLLWIVNRILYYHLSKSYIDELADAYDLNRGFATALVWTSFAAITFLAGLAFSLTKTKRYLGLAGILALLIGHSVAIGLADKNFRTSGNTEKCYVLTRDNIKILNRVGVDPETGRECRLLTPAIAEKIELYKTGRRPSPITTSEQPFFSLVSGEPVVWYAKDTLGSIEMFDLMGYHPQTGSELAAVNPDIVSTWKDQQNRKVTRIPVRVDIQKFMPFDPRTGAARVWYWQSETGGHEFYDGPGFHPQFGDPLKIISREVLANIRRAEEQAAEARRLAQEKIEQENRERQETERKRAIEAEERAAEARRLAQEKVEQENRERQETERKRAIEAEERAAARRLAQEKIEQENRERQETERKRAIEKAEELRLAREAEETANRVRQQAGNDCDRMAANPTDVRRKTDGVSFDQLRSMSDQAIEACTRAVELLPNEERLLYQLGRAIQLKDRKRAFDIFTSLSTRNYPAAFDNLGGMYLTDKKDLTNAVRLFSRGAALGDPDSMVSLADQVDKGNYGQQTPYQTKWSLLIKAAELNHSGAQRALAVEQAKLANAQVEQENARKAAEIFGAIIGGFVGR